MTTINTYAVVRGRNGADNMDARTAVSPLCDEHSEFDSHGFPLKFEGSSRTYIPYLGARCIQCGEEC